ncbi:carboxylesterase [Streptomyces davaonensis JCM 4913]|uniref:Carboxylesterase n=1 Tax=Streptomyces davaonensis (strain DSM 101723 / JCM 4913 / KCC S-0913 / 768) TaxID=1214101 RepID=K4RBE0_STRDJ|nr:alpha/beta hydrolase [Streptomyces davaonensis]CCK30597.1 carboxylesterase [Streptomyces davaonensis JCM 4913]
MGGPKGRDIGNGRGFDEDAFLAAYDKVMAKWPADREAVTVPTPFGTAYVQVCGPSSGPPLLLLPGGGAAAASWYAQVGELARTRRVYAVDPPGVAGRGTVDRPPSTASDLTAWLGAVLDGLGVRRVDLGGHSYGGWIALRFALDVPDRVRRLFLLDPTQCFAGYKAAYLMRALPMLLRPTPRRVRAFLEWETGGVPLDPDWLRLQEAAAGFPSVKPVTGPRPSAAELRTLDVPVLLLLAGSSRTHDTYEAARRARAVLPHGDTEILPEISHHALPQAAPPGMTGRLNSFLTT